MAGKTLLWSLTTAADMTYRMFRQAYERTANTMAHEQGDLSLRSATVSEQTYRRWTSGNIATLPVQPAPQILARMFPGYTARQLLLLKASDTQPTTCPVEPPAPAADIYVRRTGPASNSYSRQSASPDPAGPHRSGWGQDAQGFETAPLPAFREDDWIDAFRRNVDRTLAAGSVSPGQLDLLDERLLLHRRQYISRPPNAMILALLEDLREVQLIASERQPAATQLRLSEMTSVLATLVADALMKLGSLRQARDWYATALTAADDSRNLDMRARVRVQAAMLPYYYGPLDDAVRLASDARVLLQARGSNATTLAFAAAAEARARARNGDNEGALHIMNLAEDAFAAADHTQATDAWAFPERRFLLYLSGIHTYLNQTREAEEVQERALTLYATQQGSIDPALLRIERALCLAREHHLSDAFALAGRAYLDVPADHRTQILGARAQDVLNAAPQQMRTVRAGLELQEILALPRGSQ
ncbi:hypothetical protein ACFYVL_14005 [Streptomyces sp. NPDC004111]|uniref:hypothetical protein n=1 Tax=Streptomyces sp. NPDC004111 TaxID=3364690 RepID=UPI0036B47663